MSDPTPLTPADLPRITAYCEAATEGPWEMTAPYYQHGHVGIIAPQADDGNGDHIILWDGYLDIHDAVFIETARLDLPRAIATLEAAWEDLKVAHQIGDSFWTALKPLNLQAINVANPGFHVTELIRDRDAWKHAAVLS